MGAGVIETLRRFWPYIKEHRTKFFIAILGMVAAALGTSASAYLVKPVLDEIFIEKNEKMLAILPPVVVLLYLLKGFGKFIQVYYTEYIGQQVIKEIRHKMLQSVLSMQMGYFIKQPSGELISRLTNDINRIKNVVANMLPDLLREILTIVALVGVVIYQSPKLALYFLFIMPLALYPLSRLAKRMKKISHKSQESIADLTSHLGEIFNNIELIKAEGLEKRELERFSGHNERFFRLTLDQVRTSELISPLMESLGAVIIALVIYVGGHEVIEGHMSTGQFFSFMTALFMLYTPIKHVSKLYNKIQDAIAASERIFQLIDMKSTAPIGHKPFPKDPQKLCFEHVSLHYDEIKALEDVSFCANKDQITAIVGDSGSGKSSILALIMRFYSAQKGSISIDGTDIQSIDLDDYRRHIALVSQRLYLFRDTLAFNIASKEYDEDRLIEALKMARAWEFVSRLPRGIHTPIEESGLNLSGGQRQRLAIARALYKDPKILIFDEATSALDTKSEAAIMETIHSLAKDRIVILVSHNLRAVTKADKIIVMQKGKKVCEGRHEDLIKDCPAYIELYNKS